MSAKKKAKQKISVARIIKAVFTVIGVALLIALVYLLVSYYTQQQKDQQLLREQKVRLEASEKDLKKLTSGLMESIPPTEVIDKESPKDCHESSAKFGRGTIRCGSSFFAKIYSNRSLSELRTIEDVLSDSIEQDDSFTDVKKPYIDEGKYTSGRKFSIHSKYENKYLSSCYFYIRTYTAEQFLTEDTNNNSAGQNVLIVQLGCNEITKEPIYPLAD